MIGDLVYKEDFLRALNLFHIKYRDEEEFLHTFEKEYLTDHKEYSSVLLASDYRIPRSNNGNEGYNWQFKDIVLKGKVLKVGDFLVSLELHAEVTSYFANDKYVHKYAYYYKLMDSDKKPKLGISIERLLMKSFILCI